MSKIQSLIDDFFRKIKHKYLKKAKNHIQNINYRRNIVRSTWTKKEGRKTAAVKIYLRNSAVCVASVA